MAMRLVMEQTGSQTKDPTERLSGENHLRFSLALDLAVLQAPHVSGHSVDHTQIVRYQ